MQYTVGFSSTWKKEKKKKIERLQGEKEFYPTSRGSRELNSCKRYCATFGSKIEKSIGWRVRMQSEKPFRTHVSMQLAMPNYKGGGKLKSNVFTRNAIELSETEMQNESPRNDARGRNAGRMDLIMDSF